MSKVVSAEYAVSLIKDEMTLGVGGFITYGVPEDLLEHLKDRYKSTGSPKDLTLFHAAACGDGGEKGCNNLGEEGLLSKLICGHIGQEPRLNKLVVENKLSAFMIPQGVGSHLTRAIAGGKSGVLTHVGLKTYADPRFEACKVNAKAEESEEEVVSLVNIDGKKQLFYKSFPIDICFIKVSIADEFGNATLEKEACYTEQLEMAMATHNSGGIVILEAEKIVQKGSLDVRNIKIHGFMVDYVVVGDPKISLQSTSVPSYRPELSGEIKVPQNDIDVLPLNNRKVCGRRGALELEKGKLVNLGLGMPDGVGSVAGEEGINNEFTLSVESGVLGGVPTGGVLLGGTVNPEAIYKQPDTFDLYDGGGIDLAFLGAAEFDEKGNVNVSKFSGKVVGPGGFINITQNAKKVVFMGTFTAKGLKEKIVDGKLVIEQEGANVKFKKNVEQVTFSADYAMETGQEILYITERAVFELTSEGLKLIEIAPGIDIEKHILPYMEFKPIVADNVKLMEERIFKEEKMGLCFDDSPSYMELKDIIEEDEKSEEEAELSFNN